MIAADRSGRSRAFVSRPADEHDGRGGIPHGVASVERNDDRFAVGGVGGPDQHARVQHSGYAQGIDGAHRIRAGAACDLDRVRRGCRVTAGTGRSRGGPADGFDAAITGWTIVSCAKWWRYEVANGAGNALIVSAAQFGSWLSIGAYLRRRQT